MIPEVNDRFGEVLLRRRELPRAEIDSEDLFSLHQHQAAWSADCEFDQA